MAIPRHIKSIIFRKGWEICGHPRENPECWSRFLRNELRKYRRKYDLDMDYILY